MSHDLLRKATSLDSPRKGSLGRESDPKLKSLDTADSAGHLCLGENVALTRAAQPTRTDQIRAEVTATVSNCNRSQD